MKILKILLYVLIGILVLINLFILATGQTHLYKAIAYNFVDIDDYKIFNNRIIAKSDSAQPWNISASYNKSSLSDSLNQTLTKYKSVAYVVIKNDSIVHEQYWNGYNKTSLSNSFSMAKSVISVLIGIAIKEGKIKSIDQPVADFIPEFKALDKSNITIRHLLMMSSGINWDEGKAYTDILSVLQSHIMVAYYGNDLYKLCTSIPAIEAPGQYFDYKSGDTQLLGFVLMKATGKTISEYFREKLWQPLGAEFDALWCLDKDNGDEKAFCCLNSNARDFARIGKLYLNKGIWNKKLLLDSSYVNLCVKPNNLKIDKIDTTKRCDFYGLQWWILPDVSERVFYMRGTLGQFVIVIPSKKMLIVRLGEEQGPKKENTNHYAQTYVLVEETLKTFQ